VQWLNTQALSEKDLIVCPTKRLKDYIALGLCQARANISIALPQIKTLSELPAAPFSILGEDGCKMLLEQIFKKQFISKWNPPLLREHHLHECYQLHQDLLYHGMSYDELGSRLKQYLNEESFRGPEFATMLLKKLDQLVELLAAFDQRLKALNLLSTREAEIKSYAHIPAFNRVVLFGFTSLIPAAIQWLDSLSCPIDVWLSQSPKLLSEHNPLEDLTNDLRHKLGFEIRDPSPTGEVSEAKAEVKVFGSLVEECVLQIKEAAANPNQKTAILCTDENAYAPLLRHLLPGANVALASPLAHTTLGAWLRSLMLWQRERLPLEWATHPITLGWLKQFEGFDILKWHRFINQAEWHDTQNESTRFWQRLVENSKVQNMGDLEQVLETFSAFNHLERKEDQVFYENALVEFAQDMESTGIESDFWYYFENYALKKSIQSVGDPFSSLQVLSFIESRYYPFDCVFILGMFSGQLPKSLPKDHVLNDHLKQAVGLSSWADIEAREELSYKLLLDRVPHVQLSYYKDESRSFSHFLPSEDEHKYISTQEIIWPQCFVAEVQIPNHESSTLTATALTKALSCPYQYLYKDLDEIHLPDFHEDMRLEGEILHQIIEDFFKQSMHKGTTAQMLAFLTEQTASQKALSPELKAHMVHHGWAQFVEFIYEQGLEYEWRLEQSFDLFSPLYNAQIRGRMDALKVIGAQSKLASIIDFKRRGVPTAQDPQLGFYRHALEQLGYEVNETLFYSIIKGEVTAPKNPPTRHEEWLLAQDEMKKGRYLVDDKDCGFCALSGLCRKWESRIES
jgi:hypothetical protein